MNTASALAGPEGPSEAEPGMNLHIEGATKFYADRKRVFEELTDPSRIVEAIPGKEEAWVIDGTKAKARVNVDASEARGPFMVELSVAEADPPSSAKLVTEGTGERSSLKVTTNFELLGDSPTWIHWSADAEVEGEIGNLDEGRLRSLAHGKVEQVFTELTRAVEKPAG